MGARAKRPATKIGVLNMKTYEDLIDALLNSDGPSALESLSNPEFLAGFFGGAAELEKARAFFTCEINGGAQ
jgi:hypothetical protein